MNKIINQLHKRTTVSRKEKRLVLDPSEWPESWKHVFYKTYPRLPATALSPSNSQSGELEEMIAKRKTERVFSAEPLSFENLSNILVNSAGINRERGNPNNSRRAYPSAGALYPVELYVFADHVERLDRGLYHYNVKHDLLEQLFLGNTEEMLDKVTAQSLRPAATLVLTAVISRSEGKYGPNAYKMAAMECGHIGQNLSLLCVKYNLACCPIGGFDNENMVKILDTSEDELPLYAFFVGNPPQS